MLGHLHILLDYEWDSRALLSLVLVGLPELKDLLGMRRYRSLYSRLHVRVHIDPLTPDDTAEYLRYRLKRAGVERDVFTQDTVAMLHEAAKRRRVGGPRPRGTRAGSDGSFVHRLLRPQARACL
jgi:type II secretory pathway predicted ATPase ExeA